jgi:hypothetical protein
MIIKLVLVLNKEFNIDTTSSSNKAVVDFLLECYNDASEEDEKIDDLKDADESALHDVIVQALSDDIENVIDLSLDLSEMNFEITFPKEP